MRKDKELKRLLSLLSSDTGASKWEYALLVLLILIVTLVAIALATDYPLPDWL